MNLQLCERVPVTANQRALLWFQTSHRGTAQGGLPDCVNTLPPAASLCGSLPSVKETLTSVTRLQDLSDPSLSLSQCSPNDSVIREAGMADAQVEKSGSHMREACT
ncbi:hypothetical protein EYF80_013065 [Liparis tanakae]|uniref:Uncharacterized protein n=1 Tax=Liparis tanakae TaxID=230148 RepID=A0A4Z2IHF7_9TELE|nr:hypothetical protein EYF80_013065 [Liparis tanakae]